MKATQLLKKQHKEVSALFKKIKKAHSLSDKKSLFKELATMMVEFDMKIAEQELILSKHKSALADSSMQTIKV